MDYVIFPKGGVKKKGMKLFSYQNMAVIRSATSKNVFKQCLNVFASIHVPTEKFSGDQEWSIQGIELL